MPAIQFLETRQLLVRQIWAGAAIMVFFALPMILWRGVEVGWHSQIITQVCLCLATMVVAVFRNEIHYSILSGALIGFSTVLGVCGIFTLGMTGAGFFWISFATFLVCILFSHRAGILMAVFAATVTILAAIGFVLGILVAPFDLTAHSRSASGWFSFLIIATTVPFITLYTVSKFQQSLVDLLNQLSDQRDQLLQQRDKLNAQQRELEYLARHDPLTGLPSLRFAEDRLQMALHYAERVKSKVAVFFIDLDGFKTVNDTFGHAAGDLVLKEVASRLNSHIRNTDTLARIGGDEFMAIVSFSGTEEAISRIAQGMIHSINRPFEVEDQLIQIGTSIGISVFPDHSDTIRVLKARADEAMYEAKKAGKGQYKFCSDK